MELRHRYAHKNGPRIFHLKKVISNLKQDNMSVTEYYSKLKSLWDELMAYEQIPVCEYGAMKTCKCRVLKAIAERDRKDNVMAFLKGLNDTYDAVSDQILLLNPLPSLHDVFGKIVQQESKHELSGDVSNVGHHDALAMIGKISDGKGKASKKDRPLCTHCGKQGHTVDTCYRLHGYPLGYKNNGRNNRNGGLSVVAGQPIAGNVTTQPLPELSDVQCQQLLAFLGSRLAAQTLPSTSGASSTDGVTQAGSFALSGGGVCMMSKNWREEQHPSFINFISSFLSANAFRLNFVPIAPDFIFNCGGVSVAFIFVTNWDPNSTLLIYSRVQKLREQFAHLYVVVTLPTREQTDSFVRSYFNCGMDIGRPTFVPVQDLEMGFEKIVKIAHARGVCKRQDIISRMKDERKQTVQGMDAFLRAVTSMPSIDSHDANSLIQAIGSIEAIAKASKEYLLENTDLSADKAETIVRFFRDPKFYLSPRIN